MIKRLLLTLAFLVSSAAAAQSPSTTRIIVGVDSRLWIEGASNLSSWSCRAKTLDAAIDVDSAFGDVADLPRYLRSVTVRVPVAGLTCGHAPMDKSLRAALKAENGAATEYIVATLAAVGSDSSTTNTNTVRTVGSLLLAGRVNTVTVDIGASRLGEGGLEAHGELPILMSDYGIDPPTGLFGVIRCSDRVVVKFALTVSATMSALAASNR